MRKKIVIKIFSLLRLPSSLYSNLSRALTLDQKLKLFTQLQQFCSTYSTQIAFLLKHMVKSPGKCGDTSRTNEINGKKNCFEFHR